MAFRCRSLAAQAALERRHGRWDAALALAERACEPSFAGLDAMAAAAARYEQAEVWRLRGDPRATVAYRQASALGLDPQPGMALLRLAEDDAAAAVRMLDRAFGEARMPLERARLLPARVEVLLAAGEHAAAVDAAAELELIAGEHATPVVEAAAWQASAAVALAAGDASVALSCARQARRVWRHFDLAYEDAQAHVLIASCCRTLGDDATAALELEAACELFAGLGAEPALEQARVALGPTTRTAHGLTRREREVLELLASGVTNREIAARLHVTTRTVDTHVSRILHKLGVPSRAAATAFAHRHGLV